MQNWWPHPRFTCQLLPSKEISPRCGDLLLGRPIAGLTGRAAMSQQVGTRDALFCFCNNCR
jgi:hypothetical protein